MRNGYGSNVVRSGNTAWATDERDDVRPTLKTNLDFAQVRSTFNMADYEDCYFCRKTTDARAMVHAKATEEASTCATKMAKEKADKEKVEGVSWVDVYMMYYRAAFEHEYRRRSYLKREEVMNQLLAICPKEEPVCCYHSENVAWYDGSDTSVNHEECQKEVRNQFAKSKWPNPLLYNTNGVIGSG